jgi:hypothetical protein
MTGWSCGFATAFAQRRRVRRDRLPRIAVCEDACRDVGEIEDARAFEAGQFVPLQRRGNRSAGQAAHTVGGDDRLRRAIPVDVEQHLAAALVLLDLQRQRRGVSGDEGLGNGFRRLEGFLETPLRLDRRENVEPFAPRGLHERMVAEGLEVRLEIQRELRDARERESLGRIEIVDDVVGLLEMRRPRMHLVELDACEIREPDERCLFARDDVVFFLLAEGDVLEPVRRPVGTILLIERLAADSLGKTHERQRAALHVREDRRRELEVEFDELRLDDPVVGVEHLVEIRELDPAFPDLGDL